jgi:hypothetical protein
LVNFYRDAWSHLPEDSTFRIVFRRHISVSRFRSPINRKKKNICAADRVYFLIACKYLVVPVTLSGQNTILHINLTAVMSNLFTTPCNGEIN